MLRGQAIWLTLIGPIESAERRRELILYLAPVSVEQRQGRAVAIANASVSIGNQNGFRQRIESRCAERCALIDNGSCRTGGCRARLNLLGVSPTQDPADGNPSHGEHGRHDPGDWLLESVHSAIRPVLVELKNPAAASTERAVFGKP